MIKATNTKALKKPPAKKTTKVATKKPAAANKKSQSVASIAKLATINTSIVESNQHGQPGRPKKFRSAQELEAMCIQHIDDCVNNQQPILVTGLALALGTNRETLNVYARGDYDSVDNRFSDSLKKVKAYCEDDAARRLYSNHTIGAIFNLKNNFGWVDKHESVVTSHLTVEVTQLKDDELDREIKRLEGLGRIDDIIDI